MGNAVGNRILGDCAPGPAGRLVHPDGLVEPFSRPMQVAQVMLRYPQYYVGSPSAHRRPQDILAAEEFLKPGEMYYLVPAYLVPPELFQWRKRRPQSHTSPTKPKSSSRFAVTLW